MRELTKSLLRFSTVMPVFGARQMLQLLTSGSSEQGRQQTSAAFDAVTSAAQANLDEGLRATFEAGDRLQQTGLDLMTAMISADAQGTMRHAGEMVQQSGEVVTQMLSLVTVRSGGQAGSGQTSSH